MNADDHRPFSAQVTGGELIGTEWHANANGAPVLALHGITANHREFRGVADRISQRLVAVDLRGRGRSRDVPGPYHLEQLAEDSARVLDTAGIQRAIVVGHSMGGFVAALLADRHPERVSALVLVDGGLPLPPVDDPETILGPAVARLSMTFPTRDAYREFWKQHPAFTEWNELVEEYVDYDLVPTPDGLRPSTNPEAMAAAMGGQTSDEIVSGIERLDVPAILLRSPRGLFNETPGIYPEDHLPAWRKRLPNLKIRDVEDVNHYTIVLGPGADTVAATIADLSGSPR